MKPLTFNRKRLTLAPLIRRPGKFQMGGNRNPEPRPAQRPEGQRRASGKNPKPSTAQQRLAQMDAMFTVVRFGGKTRIFTWEKSPVHRDAVIPVFYS